MKIRVLVNGAQGKMGKLAVNTLANNPEFELVGATGRQDDLAAEIKKSKAQVVVDLTNADAVLKNIETIISCGVHPVIGTTGLVKEQVAKLQQQCAKQQLGGIIAPNFSIGAVMIMKYSKEIVKYFPVVEVLEMHHDGKLDSPSGTAIRTAEMLNESRDQTPNKPKNTREVVPGARGATYQDIPIHAIRLPGIIANLQVMFGGVGETVTLRHDTIDRQCFMPGIVLACKKVMDLKELVYGLESVL